MGDPLDADAGSALSITTLVVEGGEKRRDKKTGEVDEKKMQTF